MTADDLRAWIAARYPSIEAAARDFGLSRSALGHQCTGRSPVSEQSARLVALMSELESVRRAA
jgi:hypothetical protein